MQGDPFFGTSKTTFYTVVKDANYDNNDDDGGDSDDDKNDIKYQEIIPLYYKLEVWGPLWGPTSR